jgi:uncharacterized protein YjiS (DUF1127 family)
MCDRTDTAHQPIIHSGWLEKLRFWAELRRQRRALATLDGRLLTDIGLSPDQARREAAKPFWRH